MTRICILLLATMMARGAERPPNIVFILADDLGITDIGAYARHFTEFLPDPKPSWKRQDEGSLL